MKRVCRYYLTNRLIFLFAALIVAFTACNKIKNLANINVDIPYNTQITVPLTQEDSTGISLPAGVELSFPSIAVETKSQQYISQYGTETTLVKNVYVKRLSLQIQSPPNANFDFLDKADLYLSAPGLPEKLVASQNNVPKGSTTLNLKTNTELNIKDYFLKDTVYFRLDAHINAIPPSGQTVEINSVFHMLANPLN